MTLMGLVNSYGGLLAGRFFLGVTEVQTDSGIRHNVY